MLYFLDLTVADNVVTQFADGSWGSMFVWALNSVKAEKDVGKFEVVLLINLTIAS